jgi:tRNA dimethylallyltransferase
VSLLPTMTDKKPLLVIAGPTASGKSRLALDIAQSLNDRGGAEIVNADAIQVYRELSILTARPGSDDLAAVPHHLYGVLSAAERCSAGRWRTLAVAAIADIHARGRLPVVVGGTGLYIRALLEGLAPIPDVPETVRAAIAVRMTTQGAPALHAELARSDPAGAARLSPNDRQRIARALEVLEATGRPIGDWQRAAAAEAAPFSVLSFVLDPPREALRQACAGRFRAMLAAGALDEVRGLLALDLPSDAAAMKALGVRELAAHLAGNIDLGTAAERAEIATMQYAKRQQTWFRHQLSGAVRLPAGPGYAQFSERIFQDSCTNIRSFLLTDS